MPAGPQAPEVSVVFPPIFKNAMSLWLPLFTGQPIVQLGFFRSQFFFFSGFRPFFDPKDFLTSAPILSFR